MGLSHTSQDSSLVEGMYTLGEPCLPSRRWILAECTIPYFCLRLPHEQGHVHGNVHVGQRVDHQHPRRLLPLLRGPCQQLGPPRQPPPLLLVQLRPVLHLLGPPLRHPSLPGPRGARPQAHRQGQQVAASPRLPRAVACSLAEGSPQGGCGRRAQLLRIPNSFQLIKPSHGTGPSSPSHAPALVLKAAGSPAAAAPALCSLTRAPPWRDGVMRGRAPPLPMPLMCRRCIYIYIYIYRNISNVSDSMS
mmetsp:Transcript_30196/g.79875  ORF Transcript_30196/g.79875 Transcript_30196/m.79875 type:complete len:247 (-) Transcript_30196:25-765(-)